MALKFKKLSGGESARIYQKGEIKGIPSTGYLEEFNFDYHLTPTEVDQILRDANLPFNEFLAAQGMPLYSVFGIGGEQAGEVIHTNPYYSFDIVDLGVLVNVASGTELCVPNQYFLIGWNLFASSFGGETDDVFMLYASELPNGLNSQLGMPAGWNQLNDFLEFWGVLGENVVNDTYFNLANEQGFKFILFESVDLGGPIYDIGQANNNICPLISWKYIEGYEVSLKGDYKPESFSFKATPDGVNISVEDYLSNQIMPVEIKVAPDKRPYQLLTAHDYRSFSYNTQLSIDCSEIEYLKNYAFNEGVYFSEINFSDKLSSIGDYAFTNTNITSIDLPETVDTIGKYAFSGTAITDFTVPLLTEELCEGAFKNCYGLETINVRYPIFVSGDNCFEGCGRLTNFDLSKLTYHRTSRSYSSRIEIPTAMFKYADMSELKEIPSNIEGIWDEAFYGTKITEITLPELGLGENVFSYCSNLKKVDFSKNSFISAGTFANCTSLSEIIFSDSDLQVKDNAFSGCTALTSFPFDQATEIGAYAFKNCKNITKFNSENEKEFIWKPKITSIGENAFEGCSITSVKMTNYIPEAGKFPFTGISSLSIEPEEGTELSIPDNFTPYKGLAATCTITLGEGVTSIGKGAFYPSNTSSYWYTGNKIYLPKSVKTLSNHFVTFPSANSASLSVYYKGSFKDWCDKFMGIVPSPPDTSDNYGSCQLYCYDNTTEDYTSNFIVNGDILSLPENAFKNINVTSVEFENPDTEIGACSFGYNTITSFKFPANLKEVPEEVLKYCHHLDEVEFPIAPIKIGRHAFYNSSEWGSTLDKRWSDNIVIPSSVKEIGDGAFYKCSAKAIELPEGLETIGAQCFMGNGITSGNIPSTVTKIGAEAFNGNGLITLNIGSALTEIGDLALVFNKWETITIDENNPVYDSRDNCNSIIETATNKLITGSKNTIIPDGVVEIGDYSIGKTDIEQIIIPDSVTTIGQGAFKDCAKLTSITLPSHIKELKYRTLYNCDLLTTFEMPDDLEVIEQEAVAYCAGLTTVHINDKLSRVKKAEVSSSYSPFYSSSKLTTLYLSKNFSYLIGSTDTSNYSKMFNFSKDTSTSSSYPTITTLYYKGTQEELNQLTKSQVAILHRVSSVYVLNGEEYVLTTDLPVVDTAPEDVPLPKEEEEEPEVVVRITRNTTPGEYRDNQEITKVIIEEGVTDIADDTFEHCYNLKEVVLPSTIRNIGRYAFYLCEKLKEIVLPFSIETLKDGCFSAINNLKIYYRGTLNDFLQIKVIKDYSYSLWRSNNSLIFWLDSNDEWTSTIPENLILEKGNPNLYLLDENSEVIKTITCLESVETITPNTSNWDTVTDVYVHSLEQYFNGNNIIENDVLKNLHVWNQETQTYDKITTLIVPDEVSISIDGFSFEKIFLNQNSSISGCPNLRYVKIPEGKVDFPSIDLSNTTQEVVYIDMPTTMSTIWSDDTVGGEEGTVFWIFRGIKPLIIQDKYDGNFYPNKLYAPEEARYLFSKAYRWNIAVFHPIEEWYEIEDSIVNG